ncbi:MBL fold metallo-hydrolase [Collinsella sp. zg1085]|nr:MBL fold metallo-hydrolase [Collinsella sp. zg1085]QWT18231.1 MBL fold metallo-hydrolase [Collinsella sp. zg1085]
MHSDLSSSIGSSHAPTYPLHLHVLGSGSKGNCALIEGPQGFIMIDNGFSRREVLRRMDKLGLDATRVQALILTHEHSDHVGGVSVWCKKFDGALFASDRTTATRPYLDALPFTSFAAGDTFEVAGIRVQSFATSHDVVNPVGFRFSTKDDAIGFATDTGWLSDTAQGCLFDARILALESNHDVSMLKQGSYPLYLQQRILADTGHLSNDQAAEAVQSLVTKRTEHVIGMHVSQENNSPSKVVKNLSQALGAQLLNAVGTEALLERESGIAPLYIHVASQTEPRSFL